MEPNVICKLSSINCCHCWIENLISLLLLMLKCSLGICSFQHSLLGCHRFVLKLLPIFTEWEGVLQNTCNKLRWTKACNTFVVQVIQSGRSPSIGTHSEKHMLSGSLNELTPGDHQDYKSPTILLRNLSKSWLNRMTCKGLKGNGFVSHNRSRFDQR